ncbi:DUF305 domain-containing protein [Corynebacterium halotolerans]|uniref:DUF305 domain-containing protein n=1 Tax=Corynebacterium halotolerans YIM 70093 = DSM 44683 TaxID=1121362 RepID=M1P3D7_9CORY|nr:DUF305 domain-containing protein [Corynebacterium halotolerans]AGF71201.1 hypothetical protein A605_00925 [Corynebacterium halotolerans YIM 70093 = DSM 44683]
MKIRNLTPVKRAGTLAAAGMLALTLAACGDETVDESVPPPGTTLPDLGDETTTTSPTTSPTEDGAAEDGHNEQDVDFLQSMIPHNEQTIQITDVLLGKEDIDQELAGLAQQIRDTQQGQVDQMTGWLENWGEPVQPTTEEAPDVNLDENLDDILPWEEDLEQLRGASGTDASSIYIDIMTDRHEEAVDMAEEQVDSGQHAEVTDLAQTIVGNREQQIEQLDQIGQRLGS